MPLLFNFLIAICYARSKGPAEDFPRAMTSGVYPAFRYDGCNIRVAFANPRPAKQPVRRET
jgi:hypothetical protein